MKKAAAVAGGSVMNLHHGADEERRREERRARLQHAADLLEARLELDPAGAAPRPRARRSMIGC